MAKNNDKRAERMARSNRNVNRAITVLMAGVIAEFYLLMVNNYYVKGGVGQVLTMMTVLQVIDYIGCALFGAGLVVWLMRKKWTRFAPDAPWLLCIGFFFAVHVHPFDSVADVELPVQTVVLGSPFICNTSDYFTFGINFQQWVLQVGQNIQLREILAVQNIKGFHLRSGNPAQYQVLDFLRFCFFLRLLFLFLALCCCGFAVFSRFFCRGATAAAAQQKSCCQHHGKHFG